jgi:hypothetical protein
MPNFEPFLREAANPEAFSMDLEQSIEKAKATPHKIGWLYPDFDTYMLAPLGGAISGELARVVADSEGSFGNFGNSDANQYVPQWTEFGRDYYYFGRFPDPIDDGLTNPFREVMEGSVDPIQQQAVRIARDCLRNASATVQDANLAIRSLFNFLLQEPQHNQDSNGPIIRNSSRLIARLAMINDMDEERPGRPEFSKFVGIPARLMIESNANDVISAEHLALDPERQSVDLAAEAKRKAKECSPNSGCPSLRIQVAWQGEVVPMLTAFWDGCTEVALDRVEQARAIPFMY